MMSCRVNSLSSFHASSQCRHDREKVNLGQVQVMFGLLRVPPQKIVTVYVSAEFLLEGKVLWRNVLVAIQAWTISFTILLIELYGRDVFTGPLTCDL